MSERPIAGSRVMEHHRRREERIEKGGDFHIQRQHSWQPMSKGENRERKEIFPTRKGAIRKGNFTQNDKQREKRDTYHLSACVVCNGRCALYELDHTSSIDSTFSPDSSSCLYLSAKMIPALQSFLNFSKSHYHPPLNIPLFTYQHVFPRTTFPSCQRR